MSVGSKVHKVYKALLKKGKSSESAAKISQSATGQALATGKTPRSHKRQKAPWDR